MPVINPMWFYWIQIINSIQFVILNCFAFSVIMLLVSCMMFYFYYEDRDEKDEEECKIYTLKLNKLKHIMKINVFVIILCSLFIIFIPSKQTLIYMLISKNITYERVEQSEQKIKELIDYILEKTNNNEDVSEMSYIQKIRDI